MDPQAFARVFPLGSHLCREPMPTMSEMKKDMENLKRHGFNLIKLQENWQVDEPLEGHYDFSRYEEIIDYARRLDLAVYLGLTCEQAPNWLWRKYPDARMVGRHGLPVAYEAQSTLPADGKPGPCYDHAGARADMVRFIKELVRTLGRYENVAVWNTWQEIGYWPQGLVGDDVCYCEHTLAYFREWLQSKYGDLDGLNRAWHARYLDWSYVQPDRGHRVLPLAVEVDWRYFMDNVQIARVLRTRTAAIKEADPLKRPVFAHKGGVAVGAAQDWVYARCHDFMGSSCYPAWGSGHPWDDGHVSQTGRADRYMALHAEMWEHVALTYDYIRSCNERGRPVWAAEFQGGPVSTSFHKGRVPSPADIRRWMLTAVSSGVTAISFWVTRAEIMAPEMNGFSLLDSTGDTTPRFEEAARIGAALNRHAALFGQPTRPWADVAIVVNEETHAFCQVLGQGGENLHYSVRGWYRLLWDLGIPVDFVDASELEAPYIAHYKALILPFPIALSEAVAGKLARYVEAGGHLISEAAPGRMDDHATCNRGELSPTLAQLFGVAQESFTMVREPGDGRKWSPQERTWGEYLEPAMLEGSGALAGWRARANVYIETFQCQGSEPCLRYGEQVAGTVRAAGKGQAWLLGTYLGHSGAAYRSAETHALALALLARCGVAPARVGELALRKRVGEGQEAWVLLNTTDHDVTETVDVAGWRQAEDLLGEPLVREGDGVSLTVPSLDVRVLIVKR